MVECNLHVLLVLLLDFHEFHILVVRDIVVVVCMGELVVADLLGWHMHIVLVGPEYLIGRWKLVTYELEMLQFVVILAFVVVVGGLSFQGLSLPAVCGDVS